MRISFIGGGLMAEAIVGGIIESGLASARDLRIGEPMEARRAQLTERFSVECLPSNQEAVAEADLVILGVKPQDLATATADLATHLGKDQTVVSIVAGATIATLVKGFEHTSVIRVMPNTPARIHAGMSVWTATPSVPEKARAATRDVLLTLGDELYVDDEKFIDMATALSASGPAYVFLFIESLIDAGVYMGMPRPMARRLVVQTVLGSTKLVQESQQHPAELRDMVTSPGGTTAEALLALSQRGFQAAVIDAVVAAYDKSRKLGGAS